MKQKNSGFTLIELLVVISIIVILTMMGLVSYVRASASARDAKREADMTQLQQALVLYRTDNGSYPTTLNFTTMSPIQSYISVTSMSDPKGGSYPAYTYTGTATTFQACATTEIKTPSPFCVNNP